MGLFWCLAIGASLWWNLKNYEESIQELAVTEARTSYNKDILYRRWGAGHGGVYVPVTETTPANPYLDHIKERDIETPSGRQLTLVNPAYMTRQVFELGLQEYGIQGHLTSFNPLRPENSPDEWEKQALMSFEEGNPEVRSLVKVGEEEVLRLMRPMVVEQGCLKCHGYQNYKVGDVRGGLSVSVPMSKYNAAVESYTSGAVVAHLTMLMLGLGGIFLAFRSLQRMERKSLVSQEALQESENQLRTVFEAAETVAFVTTDFAGEKSKILSFSPGAEKVFGFAAGDIIGSPLSLLHPPERKDEFSVYQQEICKTGARISCESTLFGASGIPFFALLSVHPLKNASGELVGTIVVVVDISQRKKIEEELRQSNETAMALLNANSESSFLLDLDGAFGTMNEVTAARIGKTPEELVGKCAYDFLPLEVSESRRKKIQEVAESKMPQMFSDVRAGMIFHHTVYPLFDSEGEVNRFAVFAQDVTAQKTAEETLKKDLELNRAVAEISRELLSEAYQIKTVASATLRAVLSITDSEHGFVSSIDKGTLDNVAHTLTDMFGASCHVEDQKNSFPISENGTYPGLWGCALNSKESMFTNTPQAHPNYKGLPEGHVVLGNYLAVPVLIGENLLGLIALANSNRDYSDKDLIAVQRIAEVFALAIHRQDYENERSEMDQRLLHLQKNEAIGSLAGGIAHDFNNILTPIIGYSEFMREGLPAGSPMAENVNQVLLAAHRAKDLVKQILTFSRQQEHEIVPLRAHLVIKEVVKLVESSLPSTIKVKKNIDVDCRTIMADPTQVHQVAMNLLTNAYHAMEEDGGVLTVSLQNIDITEETVGSNLIPGPYIVFVVEDTGGGIDDASLDKIFNPYYTTKPLGKGTGLGLSVVYGIVKNFKGDIEVESHLGEGARFSVFLPAVEPHLVVSEVAGSRLDLEGTEKILLVDDEVAVLRMERRLLESYGYYVEAKGSSREALEEILLFPDKYDLLITDLTMPELTGDRLTQEVRKVNSSLPILICTGFSERMTQERARAIGADGLLMKPVGGAELAGMVKNILSQRKNKMA